MSRCAAQILTGYAEQKAAQGRVNAGRPGKDSPANKRRDELRSQLGEIRTKQQGFKSSRNGTQDKIKTLDTQLKARIQEQKNAKSKIPFRSVEELDSRIQSMQKEVDTGKMKLVDEKKTLTEISALNKQRKAFAGFEDAEKTITDIKNQISELRKELDNPEYKSLSDSYTTITTELDSLKAEQDIAFKDLNASRDALTKARQNQDEKYTALKKLQDDYYGQKRAYMDYDREANRQRAIKRKQEQDKYFQDKKRKDLDRDLEDAAYPAYADEIRSCDNLIRLLDPSSASKVATTIAGQFAAVASRVVDATGIKGTALPKKNVDEEEFFAGSGKKGKKARGGKAQRGLGDVQQTDATPKDVDLGRFFEPTVVHQFEQVSLTPPSSQEEVAKVLEQLKEKREFWTSNQKKKTDEVSVSRSCCSFGTWMLTCVHRMSQPCRSGSMLSCPVRRKKKKPRLQLHPRQQKRPVRLPQAQTAQSHLWQHPRPPAPSLTRQSCAL